MRYAAIHLSLLHMGSFPLVIYLGNRRYVSTATGIIDTGHVNSVVVIVTRLAFGYINPRNGLVDGWQLNLFRLRL